MIAVHWLAPFKIDAIDEIRSLGFASVRLRAGALLSAPDRDDIRLTLGERIPDGADVCVIGKIGAGDVRARAADWIDQIAGHRARGGKVMLDYTDDHLNVESPMTAFYRECLAQADQCICSSATLAGSLKTHFRHFSGRVLIIPDAIEVEIRAPESVDAAAAGAASKLLWFGHASNLGYLADFLPVLAMQRPLELSVLTGADGVQWLQSAGLRIPPNLRLQCGIWGREAMQRLAAECHVCLIPSDPRDPRKAGVSSNRLITALALGLPTCADPMPSYVEYRGYFGDIRSTQLREMLDNPARWHGRVARAQLDIVPAFAMANLGCAWAEAVRHASNSKESP